MADIAFGGKELLDPGALLGKLGLSSGARVGDFGCGRMGFFTLPAAKAVGKDGMVYAIDILKSSIESVASLAKQHGLINITPVWSNIEVLGATNIPEASLDVVLLVNTLYQSKDHSSIFHEAGRLLKRNGRVLVIEWKPSGSPLGPPPDHRVAPDVAKKAAEGAEFGIQESFEAGQFHYGFVATKK